MRTDSGIRLAVFLSSGVVAAALLWSVTGFIITLRSDHAHASRQVGRVLVVPGAAFGLVVFLWAALRRPSGRTTGLVAALISGGCWGLSVGVVFGFLADFWLGMGSTGLLPSYFLALVAVSVALGVLAGLASWSYQKGESPPP